MDQNQAKIQKIRMKLGISRQTENESLSIEKKNCIIKSLISENKVSFEEFDVDLKIYLPWTKNEIFSSIQDLIEVIKFLTH